MSEHIACLTFDFDVWSGWTARNLTTPTPVSRGEFGLIGAQRILKLLAKYDLTASWCVPGVVIDTHPQAVQEVVDAGHEIVHHGYSHVPPANLTAAQEEDELGRASEAIKRLTGAHPRGYRSASWDLSANTVDLLLRHGFEYESSQMGSDYMPYYARRGDKPGIHEPFEFGETTGLVELPVSWTLDDYPHFEFVRTKDYVLPGLMNADGVLRNWTDEFLYMTRTVDWGILTYTCHPFVIGRGHRMIMLERLIQNLLQMNARFMTMGAAVDAFRATRPDLNAAHA